MSRQCGFLSDTSCAVIRHVARICAVTMASVLAGCQPPPLHEISYGVDPQVALIPTERAAAYLMSLYDNPPPAVMLDQFSCKLTHERVVAPYDSRDGKPYPAI